MPIIQPGPRRSEDRTASDTVPSVWEARLRLWIAIDGRNALGPGKVSLLDAIAETESLTTAAKQLRMSYRAAWKHLRFIEERTGIVVVEPRRGGAGGGGTELTPEGRALLRAYRAFRRDVDESVRAACQRHFAQWLRPPSTRPTTDTQAFIDSPEHERLDDAESR